MYEKMRKKAFILRLVAALIPVATIVIKAIQGTNNTNMFIFASICVVLIYGMIAALSLFPSDWKTRAFQPAKMEEHREGFDEIKDKMQFRIAFGWFNVFIMICFSLAIYLKF